MTDPAFLVRDRVLPPEQDYEALRQIGMERIIALCSEVWTDHLASDPGISQLETLAYAITDLGYRTGFPTVDLMTRPDGEIGPANETGLFPAHEALTCSPITIADHRMLLLRVADVRNAWLDPMQDPAEPDNYRLSEVPIFADCNNDRLTYDDMVDGDPTHPVKISGLYKVLVELERDDVLGSLNETALSYRFLSGPLKGVVVVVDALDAGFVAGEIDFTANFAGINGAPTVVEDGDDFDATATLDLDDGTSVAFAELRIAITEDRPRPTADPVEVTAADLQAELARDDPDAILPRFWLKQQRRQLALQRVACVLNAHRPLCEDWLSVNTIAPFRVGICADIDVEPDADLERVQAEVFHAIELYFSPPVPWQSLEQMLDAKLPADEIFNGPYVDWTFECQGEPAFTKPGFLTHEGLESCDLRREVHASDIINLVMDIDGVVAIRNLILRGYDSAGDPVGEGEKWTLKVPPGHQPVLFLEGSKIIYFKDFLPFRAQDLEFRRTLEHLRALSRAALYVEPGQILPAVLGTYRDPGTAYSVQNDLPRTYGIGRSGLPSISPPERFAQARQLKGYLAHFDWLLADYLGQLANARILLSPDPMLEQTYFPQRDTDAVGTLADYTDEFYDDPVALADPLTRARLTETEEIFLDRRARALDHLLARFAERFADYTLMSFNLDGGSLMTARELIEDKAAFLAEAPVLSRERSAGFNYRPEAPADIWDTDNVPGLQKRVGRLLGIADITRRDLHCAGLFDAMLRIAGAPGNVRVRIRRADNTLLFQSDETFADANAARAVAEPIFARLRRAETYEVDESGGVGAVLLRLNDGAGAVLTHSQTFDTANDANFRAREIVFRYDALLQSAVCDDEGMHVIEHILLRPRVEGDRLMQVCLPEDCQFCGEQDPYSFRLHVVLPYWPQRFQNLAFRRFAERLIREETPAHIHPRICWVGNEQMRDLDLAWRALLEATADPETPQADLSDALDTLIGVLERLTTVYPEATLHDCDDGEGDNVVRLGQTQLGIF